MSELSDWMASLRGRDYPQAITENYGGLPDEHRTITYMGRQIEIPYPEQWMQEHIRWAYEREHHLDINSETGEITNSGDTLPNEEVLFNPGTLVDTSENSQLTTISNIEPATWELAVSDVMTDKYKEMEKRVEEQDKTISEMKSIIENLQDIVYQRKLDKEAETLVL